MVKNECHLLSFFRSTLSMVLIAGLHLFIFVLAWIRLISDKFPALSCRCESGLHSQELFLISGCLFVCFTALSGVSLAVTSEGRPECWLGSAPLLAVLRMGLKRIINNCGCYPSVWILLLWQAVLAAFSSGVNMSVR